ncbi:MAG: hypothetical protein Q8O68_00520 [Candidatus Daviesbacteria bacterium]|nr:hypothetical protein [Candidatus Daviesbacteria bacterium]
MRVIEFLKQNEEKWFFSKDIARTLNLSLGSVNRQLLKSYKGGWISRKQSTSHEKKIQWSIR